MGKQRVIEGHASIWLREEPEEHTTVFIEEEGHLFAIGVLHTSVAHYQERLVSMIKDNAEMLAESALDALMESRTSREKE